MQVILALDLLGGSVVRLIKGNYEDVTSYGYDPVATAAGFADEGAEMVHVVDLDAARGREPSNAVIRSLGAADVSFQLGGGIRSPEAAEAALDAGASRIVLGSALLGSLSGAERIVNAVGREQIVAAVDVRDGAA